jgi:hypothetical protein
MKETKQPKPSLRTQAHSKQSLLKKEAKPSFFNSSNHTQNNNPPFFSAAKATAPPGLIQMKLTVGEPNDPLEKEADAMADKVVLGSNESPSAKANNSVNIHRKEINSEEGKDAGAIEGSLHASKGSGTPLPAPTLQLMQRQFSADFSGVRIHNDSNSAKLSNDLNAQAFTHGSDVYFNTGKYDPDSTLGKHLLAHELTHTIQQGSASQVSRQPSATAYQPAPTIAKAGLKNAAKAPATVAAGAKSDDAFLPHLPAHKTKTTGKRESPAEQKKKLSEQLPSKQKALQQSNLNRAALGAKNPGKKPLSTLGRIKINKPGGNVKAPLASPVTGGAKKSATTGQTTQPLIKAHLAGGGVGASAKGRGKLGREKSLEIQNLTTRLVNSLKQSAASATEKNEGLFDERIAKLRLELVEAKSKIHNEGGQQVELVTNKAEQVKSQIAASKGSHLAEINQYKQSQLSAIQADIAGKRNEAEQSITGKRTETEGSAAVATQRASAESEERANRILARVSGLAYTGDPPSVESQRSAAQKIADQTAAKCREAGNAMVEGIREQLSKHQNVYHEILSTYLSQLAQTESAATASIEQFAEAAEQQNASTAEKAIAALQQSSTGNISALSNQYSSAEQEITAAYSQSITKLEQDKIQSNTLLSQNFAPLVDGLQANGMARSQEVAAVTDDARAARVSETHLASLQQDHQKLLAAVQKWQSGTAGEMNQVSSTLNTQLSQLVAEKKSKGEQFSKDLVNKLAGAETSATGALVQNLNKFKASAVGGITAAQAKLAEGHSSFQTQVNGLHSEAIGMYAKLVDEGLTKQDGYLAQAELEMSSAVGKIDSKYNSLREEANRKAENESPAAQTIVQRSIWGSITGFFSSLTAPIKRWFADTLGEFWGGLIYSILETLVVVVVGALLIYGAAWLIVAAFGLTIAVAKVALIIGLVLLVVVMIPLLIYNRIQEYKQDHNGEGPGLWTGIGLGIIGILDITGLPYIVEGIAGKRITGGELKGWDRGARIGAGMVMLATAIFAAVKGLRGGRTAPAPPDPVLPGDPATPVPADPVPGGGGSGPRPVEPQPVEPQPVDPIRVPPKPVSEMTPAELLAELDPTPRPGETPAEVTRRIEAARQEIELRRIFDIYEALGKKPATFDIVANDAAHPDAHTVGSAANPGRHSPLIRMRRALDASGAPDGTRTIEGRVYGDPPWPEAANYSAKWRGIDVINRVINNYLKANWETVR